MKPSEMTDAQRAAYFKMLWETPPSKWPLPEKRESLIPYGFCDFCSFWTYSDLDNGACPDCVSRWAEFPRTKPASWKSANE
jgi:hypothetical protein